MTYDDQKEIAEECNQIRDFLLSKNAAYGNSALEPMRVFSSADAIAQIEVRLDDKISRLSRGNADAKKTVSEDTILDLIGYLVLYRVALNRRKNELLVVEAPKLLGLGGFEHGTEAVPPKPSPQCDEFEGRARL